MTIPGAQPEPGAEQAAWADAAKRRKLAAHSIESASTHATLCPSEADSRGSTASLAMDEDAAMQSITDQSCAAFFEKTLRMPLTEENLQAVQTMLKQQGKAILQAESKDAGAAGATPGDRKLAEQLQEVIDKHSFNTKSYLGNKFRADVKGNIEYKALSRADAAAFRMDWCKKQLNNILEKKVHHQSWKRVDRTKGCYRNFGRLVLDFGGWSCKEAIEGATTAVNKCMLMGAPWITRHPQSDLVEYLVLEIEFEEEFSNMWSHFKET